ncbi:MAG TPA: 3'(2'),5'-bisphosphate nucleotidase CysQ [Rhizomicrobium sp.]|nr:3'(2'),5'-bisphosphate nucleotidase CysQ [Rhizomicrobium sp.]
MRDGQSSDGNGTKLQPESSHAPESNNARDDLELLKAAVREAGDIARRFFGTDYKRWSKTGGSPVTEADLAVDNFLRETLTTARPDYGWLSEESPDDAVRLTRQMVFVVDPIDGTIAFLKGRPHFTICAAVVADGSPVAGAVYNPMSDELYAARAGGGAFRNGTAVRVSERALLAGCAMLGDRSQLERAPWPAMHVQNRNSIALRLALVADASADAAVSLSAKRDWDLAAADIIVQEAGGQVSDLSGAPLRYNGPDAVQPGLIAAGPALHQQIVSLLERKAAI